MWQVVWTIKASKLCNLRCEYCYEWNELARRDRISLQHWRRILVAARRYHQRQRERFREEGQTVLVWHGGEPLLLPDSYFATVLDLEREVLGEAALASGEFGNSLQTNLYAVSESKRDFLAREGFRLGVSLDGIGGVRVDRPGGETESSVTLNLQRVVARKIPVVGLAVLAGHTAPRLREVHDLYADLGLELRLIPLFDSPLVSPSHPVAITDDGIVRALEDLFDYWMAGGCRIRVEPLWRYLVTVLQHMGGLQRASLDRRRMGETYLTVNTDGELYETHDRYAHERSLGNLFTESIDEILAGPAYQVSLERDAALLSRHCGGCCFRGACDGYPVLSVPHRWPAGPCPIASRVCDFIERRLHERGVTPSTIKRELCLDSMATATLAAT